MRNQTWTVERVKQLHLPATVWLVCEVDKDAKGYILRRTDWAGNWKAVDDRVYSAQEIADYLNEYRVHPEDVKTQG